MGDDGILKAVTSQYRSHVYLGDVVRLGGTVTGKEIDADGAAVVHVTTWARNQRGRGSHAGNGDDRAAAPPGERRMTTAPRPRDGRADVGQRDRGDPSQRDHLPDVLSTGPAGSSRCSATPNDGANGLHIVQGDSRLSFAGLGRAVEAKSARTGRAGRPAGAARDDPRLELPALDRQLLVDPEAGAVPVLANAWWSPAEVADAIALLGIELTLADDRGQAKLPPAARLGPWQASEAAIGVTPGYTRHGR